VQTSKGWAHRHTSKADNMHQADPLKNTLLRELLENVPPYKHPRIQDIFLTRGQTLFENKAPMRHLYFPTSAVVTRTYLATCGHTAEMGMVGHEGVVGISIFLGASTANNAALVHVDGRALRMEAPLALHCFNTCEPFRRVVLRYARAMICQISQLAVCNSLHTIEKRFCRWFLMTLDRSGSSEIALSHHFIAQMLAVRRESISSTVAHLQREGHIVNDRRRVRLVNRAAMEALSCECYDMIGAEYASLLGDQVPRSRWPKYTPS
jgi:CRP-like cAMP-binding protein